MAAPMKTCRRIFIQFKTLKNCRYYCESTPSNVRVRFAPSPTGMLHLGGLRTALYNYLFARANGGRFILRIEDTDQARYVRGAEQKLEEALDWAGISPHEGPSQGGNYGPYLQSKRLDLYHEEIKKLIQNGTAYHCFCTPKRLELLRKDAARRRETPKYDNKCRHLTSTEEEEKLARNHEFVVRLKMEWSEEPYEDMIKGPIVHNVAEIEGDPVLLKSDKYPTYHFANVVDDHHMEISHVFRGDEWQASTPKHIMIYKAFNWSPPQFAHLPLIVNKDGSKLSKRQNDINVEYYKDSGYFPEAVINYVTKVGGGFGTDELYGFNLPQLADMFHVARIKRQYGRLDPQWLEEANKVQLKNKIKCPDERVKLIKFIGDIVHKEFGTINEDYIGRVLDWSIAENRIVKLQDLVGSRFIFLWSTPSDSHIDAMQAIDPTVKAVLINCANKLKNVDHFTKDCLAEVLKCHINEEKMKMMDYMKILRMALSGLKEGPPVAEMMAIIGKDSTLSRLQNTIDKLPSAIL
ncbi:probable glutamate--tRNA ligase, mitochondrial [Patella vulgata]|uniref:probable glutamate--tRNA ligase, mitochondrial n=1 Tax=Patella vulgata TaxID=6465 RepID=UPI00217F7EC7|nr:probable glutamate--tRNA ligase, mitochondrial [Patella vulgata]